MTTKQLRHKRYDASAKGKARMWRYRATARGRARKAAADKRYATRPDVVEHRRWLHLSGARRRRLRENAL